MQATGSTSTKRGPDDPADGLHPVLHVTLRAGHEQEPLGAGRHLLPLAGTTCKTGRHRLTPGTCADTEPSPARSSLTPAIAYSWAVKGIPPPTLANSQDLDSTFAAHPFKPPASALGHFQGISLLVFSYFPVLDQDH